MTCVMADCRRDCTCPICLEDIESPSDEHACLKCGNYMHAECQKKVYASLESCPVCRFSFSVATPDECRRLMRKHKKDKTEIRELVSRSLKKCMELANESQKGDVIDMAYYLHDKGILRGELSPWIKTWEWLETEFDFRLEDIRTNAVDNVVCCYLHANQFIMNRIDRMTSKKLSYEQGIENTLTLLCAMSKVYEIVTYIFKESSAVVLTEGIEEEV